MTVRHCATALALNEQKAIASDLTELYKEGEIELIAAFVRIVEAPAVRPLSAWKIESGAVIGRTLSHFRITDQLGEGGMGDVRRARDTVAA